MAEISRVALFGKLNSLCYRSIESSTVFCKLRGNPYVELIHWFSQILQLQDSDLTRLIKQDARFKSIPVVIHSSLTGATNENHVKAVGANAYVAKFAPRELAATIRSVLPKH